MEERRQDYPKILQALEDIKVEMARVATLVEERNDSAIQWRGDVCKKFDKIFQWLENLPCKERAQLYKNWTGIYRLLWGAIGVTFAIVAVHLGWK